MYKLVSLISLIIRAFVFPNPFTPYFELCLANTAFNTLAVDFANIFNLYVGGNILCAITYPLVGIVYRKNSCPTLGAVLYFILVLINSKILIWSTSGVNLTECIVKFGLALLIETFLLIIINMMINKYKYHCRYVN